MSPGWRRAYGCSGFAAVKAGSASAGLATGPGSKPRTSIVAGARCVEPTPFAVTSTRLPSSASRSAAVRPATPAPITIVSYVTSASAGRRAGPGRSSRRAGPAAPGRRRGSDGRPSSVPPETRPARRSQPGDRAARPRGGSRSRGSAEAALAGAHPEPHRPADVVQIRGAAPAHRLLQSLASDQLALADDLVRLRNGLTRAEARAEEVEPPVLRVRERLLGRPRRAIDAELFARGIHRHLGHEPKRRRLAAGDRHEARRRRLARGGREARVTASTSRVSETSSSEKSGRAPAQTRSARASRKPGHELLALVEHLADLGLRDLELVGIGDPRVGRPDTQTVRIGTMMSPSAGILQRLTTVFTSRWFMAIMIPLPGRTLTRQPASSAICPAHAPAALTTTSAWIT